MKGDYIDLFIIRGQTLTDMKNRMAISNSATRNEIISDRDSILCFATECLPQTRLTSIPDPRNARSLEKGQVLLVKSSVTSWTMAVGIDLALNLV